MEIDIPTLLTFWWREAGSPADSATYAADMTRAKTVLGMANAGNRDRQEDCYACWRDLTAWRDDPASANRLPLPLSHPQRQL